jgi:hypothetical protein
MAKKKALAVKFDTVNKARILGKIGHTRTGACTSPGRCHHGKNYRRK